MSPAAPADFYTMMQYIHIAMISIKHLSTVALWLRWHYLFEAGVMTFLCS